MSRKKRGQPVDGWLALDKPEGVTSTQAVAIVRRLFNAEKAGHGGTLDPLASGILPIALGEATKTVQWVMDGRKTYDFTIRFGHETTTEDREGEATLTSDHRPSTEALEALLPQFMGRISQVPPRYSALKIDGARAYALARKGIAVEMVAREVDVYALTLLNRPDANHATLRVHCGKGTYVRSLARDIARAVGSAGHVVMLRRTACAAFDEKTAISLDKVREIGHNPSLLDFLLPLSTALDDIPALAVSEEEARHLSHGRPLRLPSGSVFGDQEGLTVKVMAILRLVALARIEDGYVRPVRVINPPPSTT